MARLLVFDLDGTLVDSSRDIASAVNAALARVCPGRVPLPFEAVLSFVGEGARTLVERCLRHAGLGLSPEEVLPVYLECYAERLLDTTRLYPGIEEALDGLTDPALAVLTNKPGDMSRAILGGLGVAARFARVLGAGTGRRASRTRRASTTSWPGWEPRQETPGWSATPRPTLTRPARPGANLARGDLDYLGRALIPRYRLYLSFTGGPILDLIEGHYGSPMARPLFCSVDTTLYVPERREKRWDLGYMGTYSEDRQPALDELLLQPARDCEKGKFVVAGPQYPSCIR